MNRPRLGVIAVAAVCIAAVALLPAPMAVRLAAIGFLVVAAAWALWAITDMLRRHRGSHGA